jgi:hypothetical protein
MMDPDANLADQEWILREHAATVGRIPADDQQLLAELRAALSHWLQSGGFPPDWTKAPHAAKYYGRG